MAGDGRVMSVTLRTVAASPRVRPSLPFALYRRHGIGVVASELVSDVPGACLRRSPHGAVKLHRYATRRWIGEDEPCSTSETGFEATQS